MLSVDQIYQPGFSADPALLLRKSLRVWDYLFSQCSVSHLRTGMS